MCSSAFSDKMNISERLLFIHDRALVKDENDDPFKSVVYFSSSSLSHEAKCWLCINVTVLFRSLERISGSKPCWINLQSLCFAVKKIGDYTIGLGCKLNGEHSKKLKVSLENIITLIIFRFQSLSMMFEHWKSRGSQDNILNIFSTVENLQKFPSVPEVYLKSMFLAENIRKEVPNTFGCVILHKDNLVFTEFLSNFTSQLLAATYFNPHSDVTNHMTISIDVYQSHDFVMQQTQFNSHRNFTKSTNFVKSEPKKTEDSSKLSLTYITVKETTLIILHNSNTHPKCHDQLNLLNQNLTSVFETQAKSNSD